MTSSVGWKRFSFTFQQQELRQAGSVSILADDSFVEETVKLQVDVCSSGFANSGSVAGNTSGAVQESSLASFPSVSGVISVVTVAESVELGLLSSQLTSASSSTTVLAGTLRTLLKKLVTFGIFSALSISNFSFSHFCLNTWHHKFAIN